jgi:hypothetical protein
MLEKKKYKTRYENEQVSTYSLIYRCMINKKKPAIGTRYIRKPQERKKIDKRQYRKQNNLSFSLG